MYRSDELRHIVQEKINNSKTEYMVFKIIDKEAVDILEKNIGVSRVNINLINSSNLDQIIRDEFYKMRGIDISDFNRYVISYKDATREVEEYPEYVNLEDYVWGKDLKDFVFNIKLDPEREDKVNTMQEVYEEGYNEGHCGLTSRYLARNDDSIELPPRDATCSLLKGTAGSNNGNHCWCFKDGFIIDTTLMIKIPVELAGKLGYSWDGMLNHDSSRQLSEYDTYSREANRRKNGNSHKRTK